MSVPSSLAAIVIALSRRLLLRGRFATQATYDAANHVIGLVQGIATTCNVYNSRLQAMLLTAQTNSVTQCSAQATAQTLFNHSFSYGTANNGNLLGDSDNLQSANTATFTYDTLNRLSTATSTAWGDQYTYDPFGNLYQINPIGTGVGQTLQAQPTPQNQLANIGLAYDAAGDVLEDNLQTQYTYDAEGRVATAGSWSYSYDGDGKRVMKTAGGGTGETYWYGADGTLTDERTVGLNPSGQPGELNKMFYLNGHLVLTDSFPTETLDHNYDVLYDQIGSTRVTVDWTNNHVANTNYYPFGAYLSTPTDAIEQRFTGKERDTESGNDYFGGRYYSSATGRWISPDPSGPNPSNPQALNLYRYGFNNPLRYTDPNGLYERDVHFDLTQVLAYAVGYSASQASAIAKADQGVDESSSTNPWSGYGFAGSGARRDFHFTSAERRADMWNGAMVSADIGFGESPLGVYLHAEQDSYSHAGFGALFGHLFAGHAPDKTYTDPGKADTMASDTYNALVEAGVHIGTEAGAVPYALIMPYVQRFNRATSPEEKNKQLNQLKGFVDQYRKDHKDDDKKKDDPIKNGPGVCPAEYGKC